MNTARMKAPDGPPKATGALAWNPTPGCDCAKKASQNDTDDGRPKAAAEDGDRKNADEHGRELHVGRHPGPEEPNRSPMPLTIRDIFDTARLDGSDLRAVFPLSDGYVRFDVSGCGHSLSPFPTIPRLPASG